MLFFELTSGKVHLTCVCLLFVAKVCRNTMRMTPSETFEMAKLVPSNSIAFIHTRSINNFGKRVIIQNTRYIHRQRCTANAHQQFKPFSINILRGKHLILCSTCGSNQPISVISFFFMCRANHRGVRFYT